jgi:hypothetical protein
VFNSDGGELHIEDCTINGFGSYRILAYSSPGKVFIKDTIVRNNNAGIGFASVGSGSLTASLDNVKIENNLTGVISQIYTTVPIRNTVVAGNVVFGFTEASQSGSNAPTVLNLESSMASGNGTAIDSERANATINMSNVTVVDNTTGLRSASGGHIVSFGNNKITNNTTNGFPTKTIAQQ